MSISENRYCEKLMKPAGDAGGGEATAAPFMIL